MKRSLGVCLAVLLCLSSVFAWAEVSTLVLEPIHRTLSVPEAMQVRTQADLTEEELAQALYAVIEDEEGNRLNLSIFENPAWQSLALAELSRAEQSALADSLLYGIGYTRPDHENTPDSTLIMIDDQMYMIISETNEEGDTLYSLFTNFSQACLYGTLTREDGAPVADESADALILLLSTLRPLDEANLEEVVPTTQEAESE